MKRKLKSTIAAVLATAMVFAMMPVALASDVVGTKGKAKFYLDFLGVENTYVKGTTAAAPGDQAVALPANGLQVDDVIWLGVRANNLDKHPGFSEGVAKISFPLVYDADVLEPAKMDLSLSGRNDGSDAAWLASIKKYNISASFQHTPLLWGSDYNTDNPTIATTNVPSLGSDAERSVLAGSNKKLSVVSFLFDTQDASGLRFNGTNDALDKYLLRIPMKVKAVPATGKKVIELLLNSNFTLAYGISAGNNNQYSGQWDADGGGETNKNTKNFVEFQGNPILFPNLYAVNFDLNTGTGIAPTALSGIKEGSAIDKAWPDMSTVTPPANKVLTGWNTQADGNGTKVDAATVITAEMDGTPADSVITLYAQYADGYSITFNGNGATTPATDTVYMVENTKGGGAAPTATRTGYTLAGWNEVANDATSTAYNPATAYNAAKTFYACWTADGATKATVTFNPVRTGATVAPTSIMINANDTIANLPTPTLAKYTFDGWYDSPNIATDVKLTSTTTFATDKTVYARWSTTASDKVTVNFYNDTYVTSPPAKPDATVTVNLNDNLGPNGEYMPVNPTKAGSGFDKWIVDANNDGTIEAGETTVFDGKAAIAADTNVIAQWKPEVTVTFNENYPSAPPAQEIKVPSGTAIDTLSTGKPTDPKRTGFKLLGWTKTVNGFTSTGECESIVTLASITAAASTETITYYAQWQYNDSAENIPDVPNTGSGAPQVLVTFQNNDGSAIKASGVPSGSTFEATYGVSLMPVAPARTGYTQSGWYNTATGEAWTSTTAVTAAVTVKPVWTAATSPFTVTFDNNFPPFKTAGADTNVLFTTLSVKSGETIGANYMPTAPARPGFTFAGWKTTATGATSNFTVGTTTITATTTLYAHWTGTVEATLTNQGNSAPMYNGNAIAASFTYQTVEGTSPSETKTAVMENTAQVLYQKDGAGAATATTPNAAGTYTVSFNVPGITFTYTPTDSYAIKPRDVKLTVTDQSKKVTTPETTLSATVAFTTLKNGAESDADIASLSIGDKHTETYKLWTDTTTNQGKIDDIELTVDTTRNAINKYVLDVALTDTNYKISSVVGTTWLQTDFTTQASYADAEKRVKFEIIPATVNINFFADNAVTTDDKTITIDGGKSLTGAGLTLSAPTKKANFQFDGWFINANPTGDDVWDASDVTSFDATTVVNTDIEVVAKWVASTDATGTITITGKTAADVDAPAVTLKKAGDYSETIEFDKTGKTIEYWSRVPNGTAKLVFDFTSTEAGSTIAISKGGVAVTSFTIPQAGDVSLFANLAKTVALDVTIPTKATNEIKIAVTPPAGETSKKTYTFHVQRLAEAKIELNYGNSPVGEIMKDDVTFTTNAAKETAINAFKANVNGRFKFSANASERPSTITQDVAGLEYTATTWKDYKNGNGQAINYDLNPNTMFAYIATKFRDPGFKIHDQLGAEVANPTVTVTAILKQAKKEGFPAYTANAVTDFVINQTGLLYDITNKVIRPDVYTVTYTYSYTDVDGTLQTLVVERPLVILGKRGDLDLTSLPVVNVNDTNVLKNNTALINGGNSLVAFRMADFSMDDSAVINVNDNNALKNNTAAINAGCQYYNELPKE